MKTNKQIYEKFGNLMDLAEDMYAKSSCPPSARGVARLIRCSINFCKFLEKQMSIFAGRKIEYRMISGKYFKYKKIHEKKET